MINDFSNKDLETALATQAIAEEILDDKAHRTAENLAAAKYNDDVSKTATGNGNNIGRQTSNVGPNKSSNVEALAAASKISTSFGITTMAPMNEWPSFTSGFNSFVDTGYIPGAEKGQSVYGLDYMTGDVIISAELDAALEKDKAAAAIEAQEGSNLIAENAAKKFVGPLSIEYRQSATAFIAGEINETQLKNNLETVGLEQEGYVTLEDGSLAPTTGHLETLSGTFKVADSNTDIADTGKKITAAEYTNAGEFNQSAHGVKLNIPTSEVSLSTSPNVQAFSFSASGVSPEAPAPNTNDITSPDYELDLNLNVPA